jgi:prepilin-type N-terminal cleavage/methylation domain-containing protein
VLRTQKGFTLIELMIVVAIIGLLAGIAVYTFGDTQKKASSRAEVMAVFAEFKTKQEQSMLEDRAYLSSSATNAEGDAWPAAAPAGDGSKTSLLPLPAEWTALNIAVGKSAVYCSYVSIIGDGGNGGNIGAIAAGDFGYTAPVDDWYYLLAHCDMDQDSTVDAYYFQHSNDDELYFINQGN